MKVEVKLIDWILTVAEQCNLKAPKHFAKESHLSKFNLC